MPEESLLRLPAVRARTGLPKATIYWLIQRGLFPRPLKLIPGGRAVGWRQSDIDAWIDGLDGEIGSQCRENEQNISIENLLEDITNG